MWPSPILDFLDWHKKRAGHSLASSNRMEFSEGAIVLTVMSARHFRIEENGNRRIGESGNPRL
jgi:hypothetical protein